MPRTSRPGPAAFDFFLHGAAGRKSPPTRWLISSSAVHGRAGKLPVLDDHHNEIAQYLSTGVYGVSGSFGAVNPGSETIAATSAVSIAATVKMKHVGHAV